MVPVQKTTLICVIISIMFVLVLSSISTVSSAKHPQFKVNTNNASSSGMRLRRVRAAKVQDNQIATNTSQDTNCCTVKTTNIAILATLIPVCIGLSIYDTTFAPTPVFWSLPIFIVLIGIVSFGIVGWVQMNSGYLKILFWMLAVVSTGLAGLGLYLLIIGIIGFANNEDTEQKLNVLWASITFAGVGAMAYAAVSAYKESHKSAVEFEEPSDEQDPAL